MPKCRICEHNNPVGIDRCQNCGTWLEQAVPSASAGPEPATGANEPVPQQPDGLEYRILLLLQAGKKIEAVKLYREETGAGLKKAKDAVEALAAEKRIVRDYQDAAGLMPDSLEGQILALLQGQKKIAAIKLYRERTGAGLKQAKDAVEALAAKHGIRPQGAGCAGMVLLLVVVSAIIAIGLS